MQRSAYRTAILLSIAILSQACGKDDGDGDSSGFKPGRRPDVLPVMLNKDLPFRYPPALYAQKVQGNVTLRVYIDSTGKVIQDSTNVAETSGFAPLDSAAVKGSRDLRFDPAKLRDAPIGVSILFPVFFRHPDGAPLAGDSSLGQKTSGQKP